MALEEFKVVRKFSTALGLTNNTDGSKVFYKGDKAVGKHTKPDGYYYFDGVTFILDAKAGNKKFIGQLEDYMELDSHKNIAGFKVSESVFECYINGVRKDEERSPRSAEYYKNTYFPTAAKENLRNFVEENAKLLADMFRDAYIDKQLNVPFIGAIMLAIKFSSEKEKIIQEDTVSTLNYLQDIFNVENGEDDNLKQKKLYIAKSLDDKSLRSTKFADLKEIIYKISEIYNFINIENYEGHDIMNLFLRIFRKWNSANANEKGEIFTPDHIAQLMYKIINISKNDVVLDPTCGSGTFLTNALVNMWTECHSDDEKNIVKRNNIIGIEVMEFNAALAGINMMLHGDGSVNIYFGDCFLRLSEKGIKKRYNKILMNPPFSQKKTELEFVYAAL